MGWVEHAFDECKVGMDEETHQRSSVCIHITLHPPPSRDVYNIRQVSNMQYIIYNL